MSSLQDKDDRHECGHSVRTALPRDQHLPALQGRDAVFANRADTGVGVIACSLAAGQRRPMAMPLEQCPDRAASALIAPIREGSDGGVGPGVDQVDRPGRGHVVW